MDWLSGNWLWIALLVAGYVLATRRGAGCCKTDRTFAQRGRHAGDADRRLRDADTDVANTIDPVSKRPLSDMVSASSVYAGRTFHFETPENRAAFEHNPKRYVRSPRCALLPRPLQPSHQAY
ncbi:YHS domain-containing protein [Breoghania corrubedonensis]|uniref:YHS domain-containing protein n=1 Tax=Breoghania corrubedonensis TaxID=665038 RepID=A0A2T5UU14_9HYPH|nr:YHS domain-containing protein [Breoghania corrubedonensis]